MKTRLTGATFDASAKTITHASFSDVTLAGIQLITNVTDQIIIYNFADTTKGGTLSTDTLTLEYDTTSMSDTDELMILVEDGSASTAINDGGNTITVDGTVSVTGVSTAANQTTVIGHLDGVEGLLTTIDADTGTIATEVAGLLTDTELRATPVPVSGTITANAGTNLNTSALALETTASSIKTAVETIDNAISGTEMQVDVLTMPTTTVTATNLDIRDLTSVSDSVSIGGTVAVTQSGTWDEVGINDSGNSITVDYATTGSGTSTGALRVELPTNGTGVIATVGAVTAITNALPAGTNAIGKLAANSGVDIGDVDVTSISAGTNLIGDVGIQPRTTNGFDTFMASGSDGSSILVATAQAVKASAGKVYGYYLYNPEAAVTFVHFYNTASGSVTVGTTSPLFSLQIPAGSAANLMSDIGITFGTAITIAATTTAGGNTAPATGVSATIWYK